MEFRTLLMPLSGRKIDWFNFFLWMISLSSFDWIWKLIMLFMELHFKYTFYGYRWRPFWNFITDFGMLYLKPVKLISFKSKSIGFLQFNCGNWGKKISFKSCKLAFAFSIFLVHPQTKHTFPQKFKWKNHTTSSSIKHTCGAINPTS